MSWIFGVVSSGPGGDAVRRAATIHHAPIFQFDRGPIYIAAGGIPETLFSNIDPVSSPLRREAGVSGDSWNWVAAGIGLEYREDRVAMLGREGWNVVVESAPDSVDRIDGHFAMVRWKGERVELLCDRLGLRTLYYSQSDTGFVFSTRLDWVARFRGANRIDLSSFGPHWLTFNQWLCETPLVGVDRLGQRGRAMIERGRIDVEEKLWSPSSFQGAHDLERTLKSFVEPEIPEGFRLSLGLSGGFDSRLLLAMLLGGERRPIHVHIFGAEEELDVTIAKRVAAGEGLEVTYYDSVGERPAIDPAGLTEYAGQVSVAEPVSSITKLGHYPRLGGSRAVMIDGGYGEIGRRQFFNRFLKGGKGVIRSGDPRALLPYVALHRSGIFNADALAAMHRGIDRQIETLWGTMPRVDEIGVGNFLDLLIVRARFPNIGGIEQARVDSMIANYMPFAQPSYLDTVFRVPLSRRKNARLYRSILHRVAPRLERYPLVKSNMTYPYRLTTLSSWFWTRGKSMLGLAGADPTSPTFLHALREFVVDTAHSEEVRSFPLYDHRAVIDRVERFYAGETGLAGEVDWWLTFELWRRAAGA